MGVTVRIPTPLRKYAGGQRQASVGAETVAGVVEGLLALFPEMRAGLFRPDGVLRADLRLFVGAEDIRAREGLETRLKPGDVVSIIPPVAGA